MNHGWSRRCAVLILAAGLLAGCAHPQPPHRAPSATATPRLVDADTYRLDSSPAAVASFPLTRTLFAGEVVGQETPVHATDALPGRVELDVVYTPVRVRVTSAFRSTLQAGQIVTLRIMGGTADGLRYVTDDAPALSALPADTEVMVWGSAKRRVDVEPSAAITPYFVYRRSGDQYVDVTYRSQPSRAIEASTLLRTIDEAEPKEHS